MATNGINLLVYVDGTAVACQTNATLTLSRDNSTYMCKDSVSKGVAMGSYEWSISAEQMHTINDSDFETDLFDKFVAGTEVVVKFTVLESTIATGTTAGYTGSAYITSLTLNAPHGEGMTASVEFIGNGDLTKVDGTSA